MSLTNNASNIPNVTSGTGLAWVEVASLTASNSPYLEFAFDSTTYRAYYFILRYIYDTTGVQLRAQVKAGGSYLTGASYTSIFPGYISSGGVVNQIIENGNNFVFSDSGGMSEEDWGWSGVIQALNFNQTGAIFHLCGQGGWYNGSGRVGINGNATFGDSSQNITDMKFYTSSGNIAGGTITQYGILL